MIIPLKAFKDNYIWVLPQEEKQTFLCVDPGDAEPVLHYAQQQNTKLETILLTHHHWDHTGGVDDLIRHFPKVSVFGPADQRVPGLTHSIVHEELLAISPYKWQVMFTPGHTSSHISYYEPQKQWLFCGDTLFSAGCGRVFDGQLEDLFQAIERYKQLPSDTLVYCAHEYTKANLHFALTVEPDNSKSKQYLAELQSKELTLPSTIAMERDINPFMRTQVAQVVEYALKNEANSPDPLEVFRVLREQKNKF